MVDREGKERRRAQEYAALITHTVKTIRDKLREKALVEDGGTINPDNTKSPYFRMSANYETGVTEFNLTFGDSILIQQMRYRFKDGNVKKVGYTDNQSREFGGETYYGEYTQEEMDEILDIGYGSNDPKDWPRDGIYFEVPLSVDIEELRVFSQFIDVLGIDPKFADKLALQLPRFPN